MCLRLPLMIAIAQLLACGTSMPMTDGGVDAGSIADAGPMTLDSGTADCQEPWRRCQAEFRFRALDEGSVQLRGDFAGDGWTVGVPMKKEGGDWVARVSVGFGSPVQYKFLINNTLWVTDPLNPKLSASGNSLRDDVQCTSYSCTPDAPQVGAFDWRDSVMAFVFVDRFFDADRSNNCSVPGADPSGQYQGGDWKGVTQKINEGHFTQLGVNTLWLTVPVKNATVSGVGSDGRNYSAYHGYWPTDLEQPESCFGTKADLIELVNAAHAKGIQVLFDFAMVHLHSSSAVYAQHPDWFWPLDLNGQQCVCGSGICPWEGQGLRCWFTSYLPHWNYTVAAAREYSVAQAVKLLEETGADGYRLDAIKHVDNAWLLSLRTEVEKLASKRQPRPRMYFVGETYDFQNRDYLKSFIDPKTKLDGQFDFPLRLRILEAIVTRRMPMTELRDFAVGNDRFLGNDLFYGPNVLMSPWVGNHDLGRVIHMAEDNPLWGNPNDDGKDRAFNPPPLPASKRPFERIANAFAFLLTSPGVPLIYYGDEIGMAGGGDPDNRRFMQWTGLTSEQQWLRGQVAALGTLRKNHSALRRGHRTSLSATSDTWVYSMSDGAETLYIAINRSDSEQEATGLPSKPLRDLYRQESVSGPTLRVPARSARILME